MVASFLRGSLGTLDEEGKRMSPEPDVADLGQWVSWRSERCETRDWWEELLAVPEKEDIRRLAWEVRASFTLPQQMQSWTQGRPLSRLPLHSHVSAERSLCPLPTPSLHAGTFERSQGKRWWHMPQPANIGQSRTTGLLEVSPAY